MTGFSRLDPLATLAVQRVWAAASPPPLVFQRQVARRADDLATASTASTPPVSELAGNLNMLRACLLFITEPGKTLRVVERDSGYLAPGRARRMTYEDAACIQTHINALTHRELWAIYLHCRDAPFPLHVPQSPSGDYVVWVKMTGMAVWYAVYTQWA